MPISLGFWEGDAQNAGEDAHNTVTASAWKRDYFAEYPVLYEELDTTGSGDENEWVLSDHSEKGSLHRCTSLPVLLED